MDILSAIILFFLAYLLGSIPTAVWMGKIFYKIDVRDHGSGNAGFTNAMRVLGLKAGIPVLLLDIAKGFFAVHLFAFFPESIINDFTRQLFPIILGLLALLGHILPVLAQFRGGKGVATGAGLLLGLFPLGAAVALGAFLLVLFISRYVSLGSIIASLSFPIWVLLWYPGQNLPLLIFSLLLTAVIIFTHRKNIGRLIRGEENRIYFRKKKVDSSL